MTFLGYVYKKSLFRVYRFKCKWAAFPPLALHMGSSHPFSLTYGKPNASGTKQRDITELVLRWSVIGTDKF